MNISKEIVLVSALNTYIKLDSKQRKLLSASTMRHLQFLRKVHHLEMLDSADVKYSARKKVRLKSYACDSRKKLFAVLGNLKSEDPTSGAFFKTIQEQLKTADQP